MVNKRRWLLAAADGGPAGELLRHRPQQRGQLHRAGLRQAPDIATRINCPVWIPFPRSGHRRAVPPRPRRGLRLPGGGPDAGATSCPPPGAAGPRTCRTWATTQAGTTRSARPRARLRAPATWAIDHTQKAEKGDQYAARHDGFTFFRSVTANQAFCDAHILSFRPLPGDLAQVSTTPAFSFVVPDLCNDGHDARCVTGAPGRLARLAGPHVDLPDLAGQDPGLDLPRSVVLLPADRGELRAVQRLGERGRRRVLRARRRVRRRPGGDVAPGPGGTSRTPGARALHCAARGILPSPHRKTQDAGAEMRIGLVTGRIKIVMNYQH